MHRRGQGTGADVGAKAGVVARRGGGDDSRTGRGRVVDVDRIDFVLDVGDGEQRAATASALELGIRRRSTVVHNDPLMGTTRVHIETPKVFDIAIFELETAARTRYSTRYQKKRP